MKNLSTSKISYEVFIDNDESNNWKSLLRYEDTDSNRISRLINATGCACVRNTGVTEWQYKKLSVYEIQ
jgi:hypothetical protein